MLEGKFYELKELAEIFIKHYNTILTWIHDGKLVAEVHSDVYFISEESLKTFLNQNERYKRYITEEIRQKYRIELK